MTGAERRRAWRRKNHGKVRLDNERRRHRADRRADNKFAMILHWVRSRCECRGHRAFPFYGGAGIECRITVEDVAEVWVRDRAWKLERPELDRVDPTGHYEISNIRFIEKEENLARRRTPVKDDSVREPGEEG